MTPKGLKSCAVVKVLKVLKRNVCCIEVGTTGNYIPRYRFGKLFNFPYGSRRGTYS